MKKTITLLLLIGTTLLFSCSTTKSPTYTLTPEDLKSLRQTLKLKGWLFTPLTETKTVIFSHGGGWGFPYPIRIANVLHKYCKAQGGQLVAFDGTPFDTFTYDNGKKIDTTKTDLFRLFGANSSYLCEGGNDPFKVTSIKSYERFYTSTNTNQYTLIVLIKATKPDKNITNYPELEKIERDVQSIKSPKELAGKYLKYAKSFSQNEITGILISENTSPPSDYNPDDSLSFLYKAWIYCKNNGGSFNKIEEDGSVLSPEQWVEKFFVEDHGIVHKETLKGTYFCNAPTSKFTVKVKPLGEKKNFGMSFVNYLTTVIIGKLPENIQQKETSQKVKSNNKIISIPEKTYRQNFENSFSPTNTFDKVAIESYTTKSEYAKKDGSYKYLGTYNFSENGCDFVSVMRKTDFQKNSTEIVNYKICNGKIMEKFATGTETIPDSVLFSAEKLSQIARLKGKIKYEDPLGYKIVENALRDEKRCLVEVKIFKENKLIKWLSINACEL